MLSNARWELWGCPVRGPWPDLITVPGPFRLGMFYESRRLTRRRRPREGAAGVCL